MSFLTMKKLRFTALAALLASGAALSQPSAWRDESGKPVQESESMKSARGFAGALLATTDEDWEKKWMTPPETKPGFTKAGIVPYGKKVFILTFFANPLTENGYANVRCDLEIIGPTGDIALSQKDLTCFTGPIAGNPYNLRLAAPVINFSADPGDPAGAWLVEVNLRDANRKVELLLWTNFEVK
ncbi:hypothetical protein [Noviherbaspirillum denitrificans]|uniref:Lipoprotein n=1 Tax=Noviherbaspirillum denitrificans TaxID=1968433 RepID=A0A254TF00_9BURK|nr:hypothetical protein [Noviherbaspirillum denitrificans]OWW18238.1 hypothetical protein AYR66_02435 [Noviherbaspirillum denitrificans]